MKRCINLASIDLEDILGNINEPNFPIEEDPIPIQISIQSTI